MENRLKQRNGCISFWLWLAIIINMAMVVYYALSMFSADSSEIALGIGLCSIFGVVNVLSAILLLRWNKIGFYMMVVSSIMAIVVNICVLKREPMAMVGSLSAIVIWWAILQMKKNGVSAWSQLQSGWDGKHCRHLYQLFALIGAILFILMLIAFGKAGKSNNYNSGEDVDASADDEYMTEEVEAAAILDTVATTEDDVIVVEEPVDPNPQEQQNQNDKTDGNKRNEESVSATPAQTSSYSKDYAVHERLLKYAIVEGNKNFPQRIADGMIVKRCYLDGDYVMYLTECDEDLYDIELMNINKDNMKQSIKNMLVQNSDQQLFYLLELCVKAHKGLGYKYKGDTSGKTCIVRIPYIELKKL